MNAIETLRAEHDAVLGVLAHAERAARAAALGEPVPADIFGDIQEFFSVFVDRCHHGKEEAIVFARLTDDALLAQRLEMDHAIGRRLASELAAAVRAYAPGDAPSGRRLEQALAAYAEMLRAHIEEENAELFPAMERRLAAEDAEITASFDRIEVEEIGEGTHERLHGMIDSLAGRIAPWVAPVAVRG